MAWNEPGGGDKDPWGGRGDQGPPDLDEAFKKLNAVKYHNVFLKVIFDSILPAANFN